MLAQQEKIGLVDRANQFRLHSLVEDDTLLMPKSVKRPMCAVLCNVQPLRVSWNAFSVSGRGKLDGTSRSATTGSGKRLSGLKLSVFVRCHCLILLEASATITAVVASKAAAHWPLRGRREPLSQQLSIPNQARVPSDLAAHRH